MDEKELSQKLKLEGFSHTYVWQDEAGAFYPDHTHALETAHIILGEMTLTTNGRTETYQAGSRATSLQERCTPRKWGQSGAGT